MYIFIITIVQGWITSTYEEKNNPSSSHIFDFKCQKVFLLVPDMVDIEEISYGETLHGVNSAYCAGAEIKEGGVFEKSKDFIRVCVCVCSQNKET